MLMLIIAISITLLLFVRTYFTPTKTGNATTTQYDSLLGDINAAKAVANQQNTKTLEVNKMLNDLK